MLHWYALVPVEQYSIPTNGFGHNINNQYNNKIIVDTSSSYAEARSLPKNIAEVGRRRAAVDDGEAILPGHDVSIPSYTRDMASVAIRPAPWSCGSNDDDEYFTDHSDDKKGVKSSEKPSSSIGEERHVFAFVHVYKSAGSTIRTFFRQYSEICHKSWMLLVSCNDHRSLSPQSSISVRALEDGKGEETYWKGCKIKEVYIRPNDLISNDSMLHEDSIDIYGGHFRIGIVATNDNETNFDDNDSSRSRYYAGDHYSSVRQQSSPTPSSTVVVRHIVFLRDPMARFVSGILYQHQHSAQFDGTLDGAVQRIKKNVRGSRKKQEYWIRSLNYLLTKSQASYFAKTKKEIMGGNKNTSTLEEKMNSIADIESRTAIQNLVNNDVIVGMAEQMDQSMTILQHVLVPPTARIDHNYMPAAVASDATGTTSSQVQYNEVDALFNVFGGSSSITAVAPGDNEKKSSMKDIRMNSSGQEGITTELVLEELVNDVTFLPIFTEYVKYEQRIHDFALEMHEMQYREALEV